MTKTEYRKALDRLELTQGAFAELLGMHIISAARWARWGVDGPPAIILQALLDGKLMLKDVERYRDAGGNARKQVRKR